MELKEGDEVTIGDVIGILPDGRIRIHHGAPQDHLAVWKVGKSAGTPHATAFPMELLRQGKMPSTPPTPHFVGCGCDGDRESVSDNK